MAAQDYTELTKAHEANAAKGKRVRPCDLVVEHTPEEKAELATLNCFDKATLHRKILAERGTPK